MQKSADKRGSKQACFLDSCYPKMAQQNTKIAIIYMGFKSILPIFFNGMSQFRARQILARITPHICFRTTDMVLDLGGGTGSIASQLVGAVGSVHVIDPCQREKLIQQLPGGVIYTRGRAEQIPFPSSTFEKVMCIYSLHHFSNQEKSIAEVARVLMPKGVAVIMEIDPRSILGKIVATLEILMGFKSKFFPPDKLLLLLKQSGLDPVKTISIRPMSYMIILKSTKGQNS